MGIGNGGNQGGSQNVTGFNAGLLGRAQLLDDGRHDGDGSEDDDEGNDKGKGGLEGNTPEFVIVDFGLLGFFELKELVFREEVSVIVGTGKDSDSFRNRVVFDAGHGLATLGANGGSRRDGVGFWQNRVDILGCFNREEVCCVRGKKMTTAVETLIYGLGLTIGGVYCYGRKWMATVRASHEIILAKMEMIN